MAETHFIQGFFTPRHPEKYLGDVNNIEFRSSWEKRAFEMLDGNSRVLNWASEEIAIPYPKPVPISAAHPQGWKLANYFPDLYVIFQHRNGKIIKEVIEIKPLKQTKLSRAKNQKTKLQENYVFLVNKTKWAYAKEWCRKRGIEFKICTEKSLYRMK